MKSVDLFNRRAHVSLSALQRRLMVAESQPDKAWLNLAENVPMWPVGEEPEERVAFTGFEPYSYAQSNGISELVAAVAKREMTVSASSLIQPKNIAISAGGMHALGIVFRELVAQGYTKALCTVPTFIGVYDSMIAAGLAVSTLPFAGTEDDWDLFSAACNEPTILYLNLPHNPTGLTATSAYLAMIADFAATHEVMIVYDAVYDSFIFGIDSMPTPIDWAVTAPNVIVVNSVSKNFGRPGDRIGWLVAHEKIIAHLLPRIEWEVVCINPRAQLTAVSVMQEGNIPLVQAVQHGRQVFRHAAQGHPILDIPLPDGGTQLWLDLGVDDIEAFADYALMEHQLILTTSSNYALALPGFIRFPTGHPPVAITRGVQMIAKILDEWRWR